MVRPILALLVSLTFWTLPDYRHPVRYALRAAGLETIKE